MMAQVPDGRRSPPKKLPGNPVLLTIAAGTTLTRVHSASYGPTQFKSSGSTNPYEGGRFDSGIDDDPYLYAGDSPECAIAEVWGRDLGTSSEERLIPIASLEGRELSKIETNYPLQVIDVSVPAATKFGQTAWFTKCDAHEYAHTREWARWLRSHCPSPVGFVWHSRRDEDRRSYVFYEKQLPKADAFTWKMTIGLETKRGREVVERVLLDHNAALG